MNFTQACATPINLVYFMNSYPRRVSMYLKCLFVFYN